MAVIAYKLVLRYSPRRIAGGQLISTETVRDVTSFPDNNKIWNLVSHSGMKLRKAGTLWVLKKQIATSKSNADSTFLLRSDSRKQPEKKSCQNRQIRHCV
jgi:hypothetical protein